MIRQVDKYAAKLETDGSADPGRTAILACDDRLLSRGSAELLPLGQAVIDTEFLTPLDPIDMPRRDEHDGLRVSRRFAF